MSAATTTHSDNNNNNNNNNNAPAPCCPPGSLGAATTKSDRPLKGHMMEIPPPSESLSSPCPSVIITGMTSMPCYCTGTSLSEATLIVVIFTDVYGIDAGHHKVFADDLAERLSQGDYDDDDDDDESMAPAMPKQNRVSVIIPDLFRGQPILRPWIQPSSFVRDMIGSLLGSPGMLYRAMKYHPPNKMEQEVFQMIVPFLLQQQQQQHSPLQLQQQQQQQPPKLSCVGFCFGGWVAGRVLGYGASESTTTTTTTTTTNNTNLFSCGVGIHPTFQANALHGESTIQMAERIHKPMLLLPGWNDLDMKPGTAVVETMKRVRRERRRMRYHHDDPKEEEEEEEVEEEEEEISIEFPTMFHGWVTRGDPNDPKVAAEQERALALTAEFIQRHVTEV